MKKNEKIFNATVSQKIFNYEYEKISLDLKDKRNILELSKSDSKIYEIYKKLIANDFMFYFHSGTKSYFIKRKLIKDIWKRNDLVQYGDLFYTIEQPLSDRINAMSPLRLMVIFSSTASDDYYSANIGIRCLTKDFPNLQEHIIKNTMIMRIMDVNLSHGSHYLNTGNYSNFEKDVQGSIVKVMSQYDIHKDDVVLYGVSEGGTGALYHSLLGDYNSVSVDPVITLTDYNNVMADKYFMKGLRKESILEDLMRLSQKKMHYKKNIIGSPALPYNYRLFSKLTNEAINIVDVFDESIKFENNIASSCIAEQVTLINNRLLDSNNFKNKVKNIRELYMEFRNI